MKTIRLNGNVFELRTSNLYNVAPITGYNRDEIFEVYARPSRTKVEIWEYWCNWCKELNDMGYECGIQIESHNCNFFTISGSLRIGYDVYDLWITAMHNRIYKHK